LIEFGPSGFAVPAVSITDRPRFPWRGLSFDTSRHFFPVADVLRTLDALAAVKMNVFHFHLSDDQGFRVESKQYPKLQELASDGFYYTQDQIRGIVAYAAERGIRVVPEFDIPGHTTAWFAAYPEFSSSPGPFTIERGIGILDPVMDPTNEGLYTFLEGLFGEMAGLFPDPYFHIGGDEVNPKVWNRNTKIQEYIRSHGLKDNHGLQAMFNRRLLAILTKHGKTMMGWDEVLHPEIPKEVVIQSWRGKQALADAAKQGYRVLLSNGYYLDLNYPASDHYAADPLGPETAGLPAEAKARVLGGEACVWAEFFVPDNLDLKLWPRAAAVAERLWSAADVKDVESLYSRLDRLSLALEVTGLRHRSGQELMLRRMAGGGDIRPLEVLAQAVEPMKGYARSTMRRHLVTKPLNRLVDAVPAESMAARQFAVDLKAHPLRARAKLIEWWANYNALAPLVAESPLLAELAPLSAGLRDVAAAGLEILEEGGKLTPERKQELRKVLDSAGLAAPAPEETAHCKALLAEVKSSAATIQKRCVDPRPAAELLLAVTAPIRALLD
jgi:hexosaminidase